MSNTYNEIGLLNANGSVTPYGSTGGGGSSSGGGHTIVNASGTEMPAENKLQFGNGFSVADDSINGKTIVTPNTNVIAKQEELSNLVLTGTTNTSGATIASGTCFILNGDFVTAKADIASGATFTLNTNYEKKSVGSILTELLDSIICVDYHYTVEDGASFTAGTIGTRAFQLSKSYTESAVNDASTTIQVVFKK